MFVYLQSVGRRNGKKNSGLSRRKGQATHDTPCDNKKKSPLFLGGFSLPNRLKNKTFVKRLFFTFHGAKIQLQKPFVK